MTTTAAVADEPVTTARRKEGKQCKQNRKSLNCAGQCYGAVWSGPA